MSRLEQPRALSAERPAPVADREARERIAADLDTTLIVEAAAGTGKTTQLIRRILAVLRSGKGRLDRMVAVTFTEVAAGEMKLRLRAEIEGARRDESVPEPERQRLTDALPRLEEARIGTIHSFCADLLRERPVEAGVDPQFEVAPEDVSRALLDRAFDRWFEAVLAGPGPGVRRILRRRTGEDGPRGLLRAAVHALAERRDFPTSWRRAPGFDRDGAIDGLVAEMAALAEWASRGNPEDYFTQSLAELARFVDDVARAESVRPRDHDGLEADLVRFVRDWHAGWVGFRSAPNGFPKAELREKRDALKVRLDRFVADAGADLAPELRDELWPVVETYDELKKRAGCLDFLDLLLLARNLVRGKAAVRRELQRRFTHIFVDEFQDTDPLQAEILLLLATDDPTVDDWRRARAVPGKLFIVGDPKQSIYRFRRADVALYEEVKRRVVDAGGALVELTTSFRAVPQIQEVVNAAFAPRLDGGSQARYVPLAPFRSGVESQPALVALPVPAPYGDYRTIVRWKIEECLPDAVAAFVEWLVRESGWTVTERERPGERVPLRARHVCLLFRRFRSFRTDVTHPYVRALEARHLPHLLVGGTSFHRREEVEAIRNALAAIERPEDELAVFATLRGPLFALGDAALLAFRERCRTLHSFRPLPADLPPELQEVADALAVLRDLHRGRNRRPISDTIGRLLAATRAPAGIAIWPTGEQALANVNRLTDLARRAERGGVISFRAFVDRLTEEAERGEASDAPIVEEGTEGVRIMTVHRAKGLEFPVVILADLTANETHAEPSRWVDAERGLCAMRLAGCSPPELLEHAADELARDREEAAREPDAARLSRLRHRHRAGQAGRRAAPAGVGGARPASPRGRAAPRRVVGSGGAAPRRPGVRGPRAAQAPDGGRERNPIRGGDPAARRLAGDARPGARGGGPREPARRDRDRAGRGGDVRRGGRRDRRDRPARRAPSARQALRNAGTCRAGGGRPRRRARGGGARGGARGPSPRGVGGGDVGRDRDGGPRARPPARPPRGQRRVLPARDAGCHPARRRRRGRRGGRRGVPGERGLDRHRLQDRRRDR